MKVGLLVSVAALAACQAHGEGFRCEEDSQCTAPNARCELSGACSAPDLTCGSGRRYSDLAPDSLASACVALGTPRWLRTCRGPGSETLASLDARRDTVVAALSYEPGSLGMKSNSLPVYGETDMLVVALAAADGVQQWEQAFGSALQDTLAGARFLSGGDVLMYGRFAADLELGGRMLPANNATALLARLRQDGQSLWANSSSGGGLGGYEAAAALPNEQVLALGAFNAPSAAPFVIGSVQLATGAENDYDAFVAAHQGQGQVTMARAFGNPLRSDYAGRAAATATRLLTATLVESVAAGLPAYPAAVPGGRLDVLVTAWELAGGTLTPRVSYAAGGAGAEQVTALAADPRGLERFAVAGTASTSVTFGTCPSCRVPAPGPSYGWIVQFEDTATLAPARVTVFGGPAGQARITALALASDGSLYAAGGFDGTVSFGSSGERTAEGGDGFLARVAPSGEVSEVIVFGGPAREQATAVTVTADGVIVGGTFSNGSRLGDVTLSASGGLDVWVSRL